MMSDMRSLSAVAAAAPLPQPGPTPLAVVSLHAPPARPFGADDIDRPNARPSPGEPNHDPPGPAAALPILVAAGLLGGGLALAAPEIAAGVAGAAAAAERVGPAVTAARGFATTALRDFAAKYREAAGKAADIDYSDPHVLGATLGAHAWTSTEEVVRGAVVGAAFGGGAWAAEKLGSAAVDAFERARPHAAQR